ncbi:uncharacterized protein DUF1573 [Anseongella ginsenosidimutans]|uniref:Uncharacterized protein DUF1573 n=1 Tax=Anseongella ginsenosidimutans TaxID=496056 RepID=A0A4R3KVC1_9SPHI|nr:DUF1573 domain-containing protein [Anseongella ginsenosidimutans]QEC53179.1 DUF1573 domain-containing protein [Anseongella ginsenosidimutans]TCS87807.1 uncharacterized protein DUF1573 [Anseongella ginsenosidimutans]
MKKVIYLLFVPIALASCQQKSNNADSGETSSASTVHAASAEGSTDTAAAAKFEFTAQAFDFGTVEEGEKVTHSYSFTNVGSGSLIIANAQASCGCTVPEWTREPIPPGGTGEIKAVFDSKGRVGKQSKTITVHANTEPSVVKLTLTGEVKAKAN